MNELQRHDEALLSTSRYLIGVDEAGRGALAGPVVAGACVLTPDFFRNADAVRRSARINDSKQLTEAAREEQFLLIEALRAEGLLDFAVGFGSIKEIAELNILGATRLAMRRALEALAERASGWQLPSAAESGPLFEAAGPAVRVIVDGRPLKLFPYAHTGIIKGDGQSLSIAMASIAAKVTRDRELLRLATLHPDYGFEQHKGYATASHRAAIVAHGASAVHRALFLRKILSSATSKNPACSTL